MPKISADKLQPGMKLAKPIVAKGGMTLLGEGTELTERWIEKLQDMEVEGGIFVEGPSVQEVPREEALAALEKRFAGTEGAPYMSLIKAALRRHIEGLYG